MWVPIAFVKALIKAIKEAIVFQIACDRFMNKFNKMFDNSDNKGSRKT